VTLAAAALLMFLLLLLPEDYHQVNHKVVVLDGKSFASST